MQQKGAALKFVVLIGFVSLCADATYEGAHSITGAYLQVLGAISIANLKLLGAIE